MLYEIQSDVNFHVFINYNTFSLLFFIRCSFFRVKLVPSKSTYLDNLHVGHLLVSQDV